MIHATANEEPVALAVPDGVEEFVRIRRLGHVRGRPRIVGNSGHCVAFMHRQDDDPGSGTHLGDLPRRLNPVEDRHIDIHQHDVRLQLDSQFDGSLPVVGFRNDFEIPLFGQER